MQEEFISFNPILGVILIIGGPFLMLTFIKYAHWNHDESDAFIVLVIFFIPVLFMSMGLCFLGGTCHTFEYSNFLKECKNTSQIFNNQTIKIFNNIDQEYAYTYNYTKFSQLIPECNIDTRELILQSFNEVKRNRRNEYDNLMALELIQGSLDDMVCQKIFYNLIKQKKFNKLKVFIDKYLRGIINEICLK